MQNQREWVFPAVLALFLFVPAVPAPANGQPSFEHVRDALDGDIDAIERLSSCAASRSDCALVAAAALQHIDRPEEAADRLETAFANGSRTAALALAEQAYADEDHAAAHAWSRAYLAASGDLEAFAAPDADHRGNRGAWLLHESGKELGDRQVAQARRRADSLARDWPPERESGQAKPGVAERVNPEFPMALAREGFGGWAVIAAAVDADGRVETVRELLGSHPELKKVTREAVERWRFESNASEPWWTTRFIEYNLVAAAGAETPEDVGEMDEQGWYRFDGSKGHIEFPVEVNGVPARAILDTGADTTIISARLAERAGIGMHKHGNVRLQGIYGERSVPESGKFRLKFANIDVPLRDVPIAPSPWFDVILARGFFELTVVQIDYPSERIRFLDRDMIDFEGNVRTRRGRSGAPLIEAEVGGETAWMLFDTGNAGSCLFKSRFVKQHDLDEFEVGNASGAGGGVVTAGRSKILQIPGFRLGPYPFETLLARYTDETNEGGLEGRTTRGGSRILRERTRYDGILGHEVMKNFVVTTDLKKRKVHFALP